MFFMVSFSFVPLAQEPLDTSFARILAHFRLGSNVAVAGGLVAVCAKRWYTCVVLGRCGYL
jgi:hypothetical protein